MKATSFRVCASFSVVAVGLLSIQSIFAGESDNEYLYEPARGSEGKCLVAIRGITGSNSLLITTTRNLPDFANPKTSEELATMLRDQQERPADEVKRWLVLDWRFLAKGSTEPQKQMIPIVNRDEHRELNGLAPIPKRATKKLSHRPTSSCECLP